MREHYNAENSANSSITGRASVPEASESVRENRAISLNAIQTAHTSQGRNTSSPLARSILQLQRTHGNRYVQRALALQRQADGSGEVASDVESSIERARGGGQAMDRTVQTQMESAFGSDFNGVRIHTGPESHSLNRAVNAVAFTTGQDIFFRDGAYDPGSSHGKELLAHELTHVVQQGGNQIATSRAHPSQIERMCSHCAEEEKKIHPKLVVGEPDSQYEREAEEVSRNVGAFLNGQSPQRAKEPASASSSDDLRAAQADLSQGTATIDLISDHSPTSYGPDTRSAKGTQGYDVVRVAEAVTTRNGVSRRISLRYQADAWVARKMNWKDTACKAACWAAGGALAVLIASACAAGAVVTLGGVAIACTTALGIVGAAVGGAGASVCSDLCDNALATPPAQSSNAQDTGDPTSDNAVATADGTAVPVPEGVPDEVTA